MKITLETLVASLTPLRSLFSKEIPVSVGFHISKTIKGIEDNMKIYDESRSSLIKKYGTENEDGTFTVPPKSVPKFDKEHKELLNTEIDIQADQISISKLGDITMTASEIYTLDWLLTE
jgi:hypothetical protein